MLTAVVLMLLPVYAIPPSGSETVILYEYANPPDGKPDASSEH